VGQEGVYHTDMVLANLAFACTCENCVCCLCLQLEKDVVKRTAVLENMPHKVAANVLMILDDLHGEMEQKRIEKMEQETAAAAAAAAEKAALSPASEDEQLQHKEGMLWYT